MGPDSVADDGSSTGKMDQPSIHTILFNFAALGIIGPDVVTVCYKFSGLDGVSAGVSLIIVGGVAHMAPN